MSKDLFDESTMSFGEHLETLRTHLFKAIIGVIIAVIASLFFADRVVDFIRRPIDKALVLYDKPVEESKGMWETVKDYFGEGDESETVEEPEIVEDPETERLELQIDIAELAKKLKDWSSRADGEAAATITMTVTITKAALAEITGPGQTGPITLNVQEAFFMYIKVAVVTGLLISAPWVFWQMWQFVAAGLYPHEQRYIHIYMPLSVVLFLGGAAFCFIMVIPFVLEFLLGFNLKLGLIPQIRMSEWVSFAVILPLMFGLSFQLPLVMKFLEKISIFEVQTYRTKRRMAVLVISVLSMLLTPADPMSMMLMMIPLVILYELGILFCAMGQNTSPFKAEDA